MRRRIRLRPVGNQITRLRNTQTRIGLLRREKQSIAPHARLSKKMNKASVVQQHAIVRSASIRAARKITRARITGAQTHFVLWRPITRTFWKRRLAKLDRELEVNEKVIKQLTTYTRTLQKAIVMKRNLIARKLQAKISNEEVRLQRATETIQRDIIEHREGMAKRMNEYRKKFNTTDRKTLDRVAANILLTSDANRIVEYDGMVKLFIRSMQEDQVAFAKQTVKAMQKLHNQEARAF